MTVVLIGASFSAGWLLKPQEKILNENLKDCIQRGGAYKLSVSPTPDFLLVGKDYEFCDFDKQTHY